jgi:hypothetical protein
VRRLVVIGVLVLLVGCTKTVYVQRSSTTTPPATAATTEITTTTEIVPTSTSATTSPLESRTAMCEAKYPLPPGYDPHNVNTDPAFQQALEKANYDRIQCLVNGY